MYIITSQFAMSHGSYDLNLGSDILVLGRDIRSRSWPNNRQYRKIASVIMCFYSKNQPFIGLYKKTQANYASLNQVEVL